MKNDGLTLGREIKASELAEMLGYTGSKDTKRKNAVRWMQRTGTGVQHSPGGHWFTTLELLRKCATTEHVRQEALRRAMGAIQ
jgi:hypothetical protein